MSVDRLAVAVEEGDLERMLALLEAERRLYEDLYALARRKQDILVQGQFRDLERVLAQEKESLRAVSDVEGQRYALQCRLARDLGLEPAELTVSRLAELAGPPYGARLSEAQQSLVSLIDDLSAVNLCNAELIEQSLAYLHFALDLVAGGGAGSYGRLGERQRPSPRSRLFNRHA